MMPDGILSGGLAVSLRTTLQSYFRSVSPLFDCGALFLQYGTTLGTHPASVLQAVIKEAGLNPHLLASVTDRTITAAMIVATVITLPFRSVLYRLVFGRRPETEQAGDPDASELDSRRPSWKSPPAAITQYLETARRNEEKQGTTARAPQNLQPNSDHGAAPSVGINRSLSPEDR